MPEISIAEIASGLFRVTKNSGFVNEFIDSLRAIPNFSFVPIDSRMSSLAVEVITKTNLKGADSLYVSLALDYHLTLITLDKEQLVKSQKIISVREPGIES